MILIRNQQGSAADRPGDRTVHRPAPTVAQNAPVSLTLEQTIRDWHRVGHSQRSIARELSIDRRKVMNVIDHVRS
jgi:hypothetical protein